mmetsp:Transcript_32853/g.105329  ORF Transcript_32853/g.105329 Transcript_32853/m.105329 type:complete len:301 (+) Transcript_32853:382-1284(+)
MRWHRGGVQGCVWLPSAAARGGPKQRWRADEKQRGCGGGGGGGGRGGGRPPPRPPPPPPPPQPRCFSSALQRCFGPPRAAAEGSHTQPCTPPRCHLMFSEASGGSMLMQWGEPSEGASLACFEPGVPTPAFKLHERGGRSELCRGVGGPSAKPFYQGWLSFIKIAQRQQGRLTHLSNLPSRPVALYFATGTAVRRLDVGTVKDLGACPAADAVAAVPLAADGLSLTKLDAQLFLSIGDRLGASMPLGAGSTAASGQPPGLPPRLPPPKGSIVLGAEPQKLEAALHRAQGRKGHKKAGATL